jgi:rsbT co-antagonist protein RsbR
LLEAIVASGAQILLFDVTGVSRLDGAAVRGLFDIIRSAKLMGARVIVTGIRAGAALELATSGLDVTGLSTYSTIAKGLAEALRRIRKTS